MIKLTSKRMEEVVKEKTGKDVMYVGVFVDDNSNPIKPIRHGFALRNEKNLKIISVLEKEILKSLL